MNSNMQLLSFFVSFIFGIVFCLITILNFKLIKSLKRYVQHLLTFIYVIDMVIIYIILLYHLNKGYFHIYFIALVFIGFFCGFIIYKKLLSKIDVNRLFKNWKKSRPVLVSNWNRMGKRCVLELVKRKKRDFFWLP